MANSSVKAMGAAVLACVTGGALTWVGALAGLCPLTAIWPVAVVCAVLGVAAQAVKGAVLEQVDNRTRTLRSRLEDLRRDLGDVHGLVRLQPFTHQLPLPMGGGWALTGDSAAILVREALLRRVETVVELGSGVSTLLLGQVLKNQGKGRLLSIDHDAMWADRTRRNVVQMGLQDYVTVVHAPLVPTDVAGATYDWYALPAAVLDQLGMIDLLLVDGPPQMRQEALGARYPAMPQFLRRLSTRALVFVDDASRATETAMVDRWTRDVPGWSVERYNTVDGVCLLSRG